jgi:hypothetical protein
MLWHDYREFYDGIWEHYRPVDYLEGLLTEKIATECIRFSRLLGYESTLSGVRVFMEPGVDRLLRYQSAINRQLFQAMKELDRLQDKRKDKPNPFNGSGQEPDEETAGPTTPSDGQNHDPRGELAPVEIPPIEIDETPGPSQGDPLPASAQPATDGQQSASQPCPQAANYGTNPTGAQPREPDAGTAPDSFLGGETSLADPVSQSTGPPPASAPADLASPSREHGERGEHDAEERPRRWG